MTTYYRPVARTDHARPSGAYTLAGGWTWFDTVEELHRDAASRLIAASDAPRDVLERLTAPRASIAGLDLSKPCLMGILNVTPDSFSDGGEHFEPAQALAHTHAMIAQGAQIVDVGGESTRPGASEVSIDEEIKRTAPVIKAIRAQAEVPISIDTRKAAVARAAHAAGAGLINDVAGFTFDPALAPFAAEAGLPVCVMHAQGTPEIMQRDPRYDNVALDIYDYLSDRIETLVATGIPRGQIITDPGIGFGKTLEHNLTLLQNLSLFHALGCPVLLGASRKRFIGTIGGTAEARNRAPGSIAVALAGVAQGVQLLRVHDVGDTAEALRLWQAATLGQTG
ncbi:Dihydropteroate synthase [Roseovarius litorisediminis]|uniref:Dihydropteroate synthase n=1 Tax=Roseovarius litorisediminis TaxID=1312363 RepID=A0A1Y5S6F6_9RHOB|nr:dihydropteroate synthase [Roseovarius litorisediminis]SLN33027.1 Dihydropteroate synthase [Roseovarius litorisediminis]